MFQQNGDQDPQHGNRRVQPFAALAEIPQNAAGTVVEIMDGYVALQQELANLGNNINRWVVQQNIPWLTTAWNVASSLPFSPTVHLINDFATGNYEGIGTNLFFNGGHILQSTTQFGLNFSENYVPVLAPLFQWLTPYTNTVATYHQQIIIDPMLQKLEFFREQFRVQRIAAVAIPESGEIANSTIMKSSNSLDTLLNQCNLSLTSIPDNFKCVIMQGIIEGTPVYTVCTSTQNPNKKIFHYFQEDVIVQWLKQYPSHPITNNPLTAADLIPDYITKHKIEFLNDFLQINIFYFKKLTPVEAEKHVKLFIEAMDKQFAHLNQHASPALIDKTANEINEKLFSEPKNNQALVPVCLSSSLHNFGIFNSNPYQTFGVSPSASSSEIQRHWRQILVRKYHPDKTSPQNAGKFTELMAIKEALLNPEQRKQIDQYLTAKPHEQVINPYQILDLKPDATRDEILERYMILSRLYISNTSSRLYSDKFTDKFTLITTATDILLDPQQRAKVDKDLLENDVNTENTIEQFAIHTHRFG